MLGSARMRTLLLGVAKVLAVPRKTDRGVLVVCCRLIPLVSENVLWVGDAGLADWQSSECCSEVHLTTDLLPRRRGPPDGEGAVRHCKKYRELNVLVANRWGQVRLGSWRRQTRIRARGVTAFFKTASRVEVTPRRAWIALILLPISAGHRLR